MQNPLEKMTKQVLACQENGLNDNGCSHNALREPPWA